MYAELVRVNFQALPSMSLKQCFPTNYQQTIHDPPNLIGLRGILFYNLKCIICSKIIIYLRFKAQECPPDNFMVRRKNIHTRGPLLNKLRKYWSRGLLNSLWLRRINLPICSKLAGQKGNLRTQSCNEVSDRSNV